MTEQNKDAQAANVQINGVPLEQVIEIVSDVKKYGVAKPTLVSSTFPASIAEEVVYILAGHKLSADEAIAILDKAKLKVSEYATLYRSE